MRFDSLFDEAIDRRGTHCAKWDKLEARFGVSPDDGIAMWVADMDFRAAPCIQDELRKMFDHGIYGYFGDDVDYKAAISWWQKTRNGWEMDPEAIFTTNGIVNGTALCIDLWSQPGDGIVLMTPVYHAFHRVIAAADREIVQCEMTIRDGRYELDIAAWDAQMTGREKIFLLCSPHNPGGRVWTLEELRSVADFCERHDLILVSDEIHSDLIFPGHKHIPMPIAAPEVKDRLVTMVSSTKTFNIAGAHVGNVIIEDESLRKAFAKKMTALGISPNAFGLRMATAAYSPAGAEWVDALMTYLDGNRQLFDAAMDETPGLTSMYLEGTYLAWVSYAGTGLAEGEVLTRIEKQAKIAINNGPTFGKGGETWLRFNLAMPRSQIEEAVRRIKDAFADLQ